MLASSAPRKPVRLLPDLGSLVLAPGGNGTNVFQCIYGASRKFSEWTSGLGQAQFLHFSQWTQKSGTVIHPVEWLLGRIDEA